MKQTLILKSNGDKVVNYKAHPDEVNPLILNCYLSKTAMAMQEGVSKLSELTVPEAIEVEIPRV